MAVRVSSEFGLSGGEQQWGDCSIVGVQEFFKDFRDHAFEEYSVVVKQNEVRQAVFIDSSAYLLDDDGALNEVACVEFGQVIGICLYLLEFGSGMLSTCPAAGPV